MVNRSGDPRRECGWVWATAVQTRTPRILRTRDVLAMTGVCDGDH